MPLNPVLANVIIIAVLAAIVGGVVYYLYRAKKRGDKCIGCPYSKQCSNHNCQKK
ncbi:MAG: FeoB-associated Cys-rich membrane protein [Oscillospiraceae bacterium]